MTMQAGVYALTNVSNDLAMDLSGMDHQTPIGKSSFSSCPRQVVHDNIIGFPFHGGADILFDSVDHAKM